MILFVRKIPSNTLPSELHDFVGPALKGGLFLRSGRILKAGILMIRNERTKWVEYHGYVHVESDKAGLRAIRKLNGKFFKNRVVIVREYKFRSWHNDPRLNNEHASPKNMERRIKDRRRGNIVVIDNEIIALQSLDTHK